MYRSGLSHAVHFHNVRLLARGPVDMLLRIDFVVTSASSFEQEVGTPAINRKTRGGQETDVED